MRNFDGATMRQYQLPPRAFEPVHCRRESSPKGCGGSGTLDGGGGGNSPVGYNPVLERRFASSATNGYGVADR